MIASLLDMLSIPKLIGFFVLEPNSYVSVNSVIGSRDAIFDETRFTSISRPKDMTPTLTGTDKEDEATPSTCESLELRRSKREIKAKSFGPDFQLYLVEGSRDAIAYQYNYCFGI